MRTHAVETEREASGFGFVAAPETKNARFCKYPPVVASLHSFKTDVSGERFPPETRCDVCV